jgi:hypothetical protein
MTIIDWIGGALAGVCIWNIFFSPSTPKHETVWVLGAIAVAAVVVFGHGGFTHG